jgi:hypothetical protein
MIGLHNALACLPSGVENERGGSYDIFIIDPPKIKSLWEKCDEQHFLSIFLILNI